MSARVAVIGGGIAGLTAAYRLTHGDDALPAAAVAIFETGAVMGGRIRTETVDGLVIDAGPDAMLDTRPWGIALANEVGLGPRLQRTRPWRHRAFIRRGGRLHPMPDGLSGLVPGSPTSWLRAGMLSWPGRVRAAFDLAIPASRIQGDESLASFARRRFGREAWEWLIEPLLAGIHGGDGERLGIDSTFPALREAERRAGSVIRGLNVPRGRSGSTGASPFVTPVAGMQALTDALVARLAGSTMHLSRAVRSIARTADGWVIDAGSARFEADAVILAVPANVAAPIVRDADDRLAGLLDSIPFSSTIVVHAAFRRSDVTHPLEGHGYLNPRRGGRAVAACTWTSSKFENRASADLVLLRGFLKGPSARSLDDGEVSRLFREELGDAVGITAAPVHERIFRFIDSMPQYVVGHSDRVSAIEREARHLPGLFLAGNSYRGIGIPDAVHSAETAAAAARLHVTSRTASTV